MPTAMTDAADDREQPVLAGLAGQRARPATEVTVEPTISGVISRPLTVGDGALHGLLVERQERHRAEQAEADEERSGTMVSEKFLILNTCSGSIGSAARRSVDEEPGEARRRRARSAR